MYNVFQLATNDQSVTYLGQIFGNVGIALSGTGPALLSAMFKTFNTAMLVVGALIVAYTTVVGVLNTATEGKFLGEKWNSLWVPLRVLLGLVALFPTASGYCAAQVVIMWVVVQGVGAADQVWNTVVRYYGAGGGATAPTPEQAGAAEQLQGKDAGGQIPAKLKELFKNAVCQAALTKLANNDASAQGRSTPYTIPDGGQVGYQFGTNSQRARAEFKQQECGVITWSGDVYDPNQSPPTVPEDMKAGLRSAVQALVPVYENLANYYVNLAINDPKCWTTTPCAPPGKAPDVFSTMPICKYFDKYLDFKFTGQCVLSGNKAAEKVLSYAGSNFIGESIKLMTGYANNYTVQAQIEEGGKEDPTKVAMTQGWIFAGAYYYNFAKEGNRNTGRFGEFTNNMFVLNLLQDPNAPTAGYPGSRFAATEPQLYNFRDISGFGFKVDGKDIKNPDALPVQYFYCGDIDNTNESMGCKNNGGAETIFAAARGRFETAGGIRGVSGGGGGGPGASELAGASKNIMNQWMGNLTAQKTDPLVSVARFGHQLLIAAEVLFWVFFAVTLGLGAAQTYYTVFGTSVNPVAGVAQAILQFFTTPTWFLLGYMVTIGGTLGVYTPLIPYINFTFGAIGWMLAVIEAMVAGPIIALGILSPGGQSEILGRAEGSTFILLNIFLRPTLMVFGMMLAMLLTYVVISFINAAFLSVVSDIATTINNGTGTMGLLEVLLFIMVYAMLVVTALNKCFSLIGLLPDQVLRWIGQTPEKFGDTEAAGAAKEGVGAGGAAGMAASKGAMAAPGAVAGLRKEAQEIQGAAAKARSAKAGGGS